MNKLFFLFIFSFLSISLITTNKCMVTEQPSHSYLLTMPEDIQNIIFSYALCEWKENHKTFRAAANTCAALQFTCKKFVPIEKVVTYMNVNDSNKNIFLMRAAQAGIPCCVQYAINLKAALDYIEKPLGLTPLSSAVRCDDFKSCVLLLNAGANPNQPEEYQSRINSCYEVPFYPRKYQPIHLAVKNKNIKIVELLILHNANVNAPSGNDETPLDLARTDEIIKLLCHHGARSRYGASSGYGDLLAE